MCCTETKQKISLELIVEINWNGVEAAPSTAAAAVATVAIDKKGPQGKGIWLNYRINTILSDQFIAINKGCYFKLMKRHRVTHCLTLDLLEPLQW